MNAPGAARKDVGSLGPLFQRAAPFSDLDTSLEAAKSIEPHLQRLEAAVLQVIIGTSGGVTDEQVEAATGLKHQTASARRRALVLKGLVVDSGERRKTSSGRTAVVWRVA